MIKLQVDHNKHPSGSGVKLEIKKSKDKKGTAPENQPIPEEQKSPKPAKEKQPKQDKKDKKDKKEKKEKDDKKKDKKQQDEAKGKSKKDKAKQKEDKKNKEKKDKKDKKDKDKMSSSILKANEDKEEAAIKSINKSQERAKITIQELIEQYKDTAQKILFNNHGSDPEKEKEIEMHLKKLQKEKQQRHQKLQQLEKHKQQIQQSRLRRKQAKRQLRKEKEREKKIDKIQQKLKSLEETSQERKKEYSKFLEYVRQRKKFVPRFKRYEQQYKQKLSEQQENSRQLIEQIKKTYVPMNLEDINQFQEHYMSQKEESQNYRYNKLRLQQDMIRSQNQKMKKSLWRGKCHQYVKEQLAKQEEKKQEDFAKEENRKEFGKYIKDKIMKSVDKEDQDKLDEEEEQTEDKPHVHIREKYLKGINYGLVKQEKVVPLEMDDKVKLGNQYLAQIKQLNKHRKNKTVDYNSSAVASSKPGSLGSGSKYLSDSQQLRGKSKTYKLRRKSNPYYPSQGNRASLDLNNYQSIEYTLEKIETANREKKLQDQIIRHGQYQGILEIQERKKKAGSIVVKQINQKLKLLQKL